MAFIHIDFMNDKILIQINLLSVNDIDGRQFGFNILEIVEKINNRFKFKAPSQKDIDLLLKTNENTKKHRANQYNRKLLPYAYIMSK